MRSPGRGGIQPDGAVVPRGRVRGRDAGALLLRRGAGDHDRPALHEAGPEALLGVDPAHLVDGVAQGGELRERRAAAVPARRARRHRPATAPTPSRRCGRSPRSRRARPRARAPRGRAGHAAGSRPSTGRCSRRRRRRRPRSAAARMPAQWWWRRPPTTAARSTNRGRPRPRQRWFSASVSTRAGGARSRRTRPGRRSAAARAGRPGRRGRRPGSTARRRTAPWTGSRAAGARSRRRRTSRGCPCP